MARSGRLETKASPPAMTPGSNDDVVDAVEVARRKEGRLIASTARVAASAQSVAAAAATTMVREVVCISANLLSCKRRIARPGNRSWLDPSELPEPAWRIERVGRRQRHVQVVVAQHHVQRTFRRSGWKGLRYGERRRVQALPEDHAGPL